MPPGHISKVQSSHAMQICLACRPLDMLRPFINMQAMMTASLVVLAGMGLNFKLLGKKMEHNFHLVKPLLLLCGESP